VTPVEVAIGIRRGIFARFSDIPEEHQTIEAATRWVDLGKGSLYDIPERLITDPVRVAAMSPSSVEAMTNNLIIESFMNLKPWQTGRYEELALLGMKRANQIFTYVDDEFLTKEFLMQALMANAHALMPLTKSTQKRIKHAVDQEVVDFAVSLAASYLFQFGAEQLTDKSVRSCIANQSFNYKILIDIGFYHVLVDMIREGFWPGDRPSAPDSLEGGIERFLPIPECLLHRAYILQFPIQDVITQMNTPERKNALFHLYSADDLTPYLKTTHLGQDKAFKGRILESGMGL
jgi:hypothetical protein